MLLPLSSVKIFAFTSCPVLDLVSNPLNRLSQILSSLNYYLICSLLEGFSACVYAHYNMYAHTHNIIIPLVAIKQHNPPQRYLQQFKLPWIKEFRGLEMRFKQLLRG